jgi:hypothetical protein
MGILDELREQAENVKTSSETEKERCERLHQKYLQEINPKLQLFYRFLHELVSHLNYINLDLYATYDFPVVGAHADFKQGQYRIVADSDTEMKDIKFQFVCERPGEFSFFIDNRSEVERVEDFLSKHHIQFYAKKEKDQRYNVISGDFRVKGVVPILIRMSADIEESKIIMTLTNFDGFGVRRLLLNPEQITESLLDRFGSYILRREAEFLQTKLSEQDIQKIRETMLREKAEQEEELKQLAFAEEAARMRSEKAPKKGLLNGLFSKDKNTLN